MQILIVISLLSSTANPLVWTTKTPLPQIAAGSACAVYNDTIYVVGGRGPSSQYTTNYVYDPLTDNWSTKTSMNVARGHICAGVINDKMYVIGGWVGSTASDVVEEYDFTTDAWTTKAPMPTPRYAYALAVVNDLIYVFGGMNMSGNIFNTVEEYNPATDTWTTKASMLTARMGPACAVVRDTVYIFGGSTSIGGGATTVNQFYDPGTDTWGTELNMPTARYCLGGWSLNDLVYALGGYDYYSYHATLEVYNPSTNSWTTEVPMQYARQSIAVGLVENQDCVYIIGGWNNGPLSYNEEGWFETSIYENMQTYTMDISVTPNPFSNSTKIKIHSGTSVHLEPFDINIYDISGRLVKKIESDYAGNALSIQWNGTNNNGNELPSGTYLLVIENNDLRQTEKLLLIR